MTGASDRGAAGSRRTPRLTSNLDLVQIDKSPWGSVKDLHIGFRSRAFGHRIHPVERGSHDVIADGSDVR